MSFVNLFEILGVIFQRLKNLSLTTPVCSRFVGSFFSIFIPVRKNAQRKSTSFNSSRVHTLVNGASRGSNQSQPTNTSVYLYRAGPGPRFISGSMALPRHHFQLVRVSCMTSVSKIRPQLTTREGLLVPRTNFRCWQGFELLTLISTIWL